MLRCLSWIIHETRGQRGTTRQVPEFHIGTRPETSKHFPPSRQLGTKSRLAGEEETQARLGTSPQRLASSIMRTAIDTRPRPPPRLASVSCRLLLRLQDAAHCPNTSNTPSVCDRAQAYLCQGLSCSGVTIRCSLKTSRPLPPTLPSPSSDISAARFEKHRIGELLDSFPMPSLPPSRRAHVHPASSHL